MNPKLTTYTVRLSMNVTNMSLRLTCQIKLKYLLTYIREPWEDQGRAG